MLSLSDTHLVVDAMSPANGRTHNGKEALGIKSRSTAGLCCRYGISVFSCIEADGYRSLNEGERVRLDWEPFPSGQDGYFYRATRVVRSAP